jgi:Tfp pilus assembly protein PilN
MSKPATPPASNPAAARATGGSFLPEDYVQRKGEVRTNFITLSLFGVVMFAVVGAFFVTNRRWQSIREQQQTINTQYQHEAQKIDQLKALEAQRAAMLEKAEITTALIEKVPRSVLLAELITRMPSDLTILEMKLKSKRIEPPKPVANPADKKVKTLASSKKVAAEAPAAAAATAPKEEVKAPKFEFTLNLQGVAGVNNDISDYLTSLKGCTLLDRLELPYSQVTTVDQVELRKFEIQANIATNADARATTPAAIAEANAKLQKQQILTAPTGNTRMTITPTDTITNAEPAKPD